MPQNVQTISDATASEAGMRRNASWIEWNILSTSAPRSITYPISTNSGIEIRTSLVIAP